MEQPVSSVLTPESCALVVTDRSGPVANDALALASACQILTLIGEPTGLAHNGDKPYEQIFIKHGGNAFYGTELEMLLRSASIRTVVLAGGSAGEMILDAADALIRGYSVAILARPEALAEIQALALSLFSGKESGAPAVVTLSDLQSAWGGETIGARNWQAVSKDDGLLRSLEERIDPRHTAYMLIDVQNDFCTPANGNDPSFSMIDGAMRNVERLLDSARDAGSTVVFVQVENGPMFRGPGSPRRFPGTLPGQFVMSAGAAEFSRDRFQPETWPELCTADSWGLEFVQTISPRSNEIVLRKHRFSAFIDTGLDVLLRKRGIRTIVLVGFLTNVCVESTARDASMLDFYVVVPEDAVGVRDMNVSIQHSSLTEIRARFGLVVPTKRIVDVWDGYSSHIEAA